MYNGQISVLEMSLLTGCTYYKIMIMIIIFVHDKTTAPDTQGPVNTAEDSDLQIKFLFSANMC